MAEFTRAIARLMEERAQAPAEPPQQRQLFEHLQGRLPPGERAPAETFARLLLGRAGSEYAERSGEESLIGMCVSAYRFFAAPGPEPRLRVFNPEFERDGWDAPVTVVETALADRPFIVDTVREALHAQGCAIRTFLHPVLGCERDARQAAVSIAAPERLLRHESFVHAEIERVAEAETLASLESDLHDRLRDVLLVTDDYQAMRRTASLIAEELRQRPDAVAGEPPPEEFAAFLEWLGQGSFVFLGFREYRLGGEEPDQRVTIEPGSGLGLMRKEDRSRFAARPLLRELPSALGKRLLEAPPFIITKTNTESPIHRRARMDYIGVRDFDRRGRIRRERRFIGLFTARAYDEEAAGVPLLRRKLGAILAAEGALDGSHDYRAIVTFFNSFPKEYLFAATAEELRDDIRVVLAAEQSNEVNVSVRPDSVGRGIFVMVVLPRDQYSADLRWRIEAAVVRASSGILLDHHVSVDESELARLHFYIAAAPETAVRIGSDELRREVREMLRTWDDRLRDILVSSGKIPGARSLAQRYARLFPPQYKAATAVEQAARDVAFLEDLQRTREPQVDLSAAEDTRFVAVKLYLLDELVLSDFLPVLENLGLRVFGDDALEVPLPDLGTAHIRAFAVQPRRPDSFNLERTAPLLGEAILAQRNGHLIDDGLNCLISAAALSWRQVNLLRVYANHAAQAGVATLAVCTDALSRYPQTARLLWEYFGARFEPSGGSPRERLAETLPKLEQRVLGSLDAVETVLDDRILRALLATMTATVRSNFFAAAPPEALAVKIESARLSHLPRPRPLFEIFVYAPHTEGVHLRAGRVARGGLRLSDRTHDYRTEVLDLMKTQMAKNAVIVPTGAKGGFLVRGSAGTTPSKSQTIEAYRTFVSSLLALTDNLGHGRLVPAEGVLYDEPDRYLVVAADKGTATFSDIANQLALAHQFWLGDAFASGGSHGYDHKAFGITARGGWECVRRHFRELGADADRDPITVAGIGDMSGDVFGNAMLLSPHLRLRAAFNHRHIFLDPDPDPKASFEERQRLFALPNSGWDDYRNDRISGGGGVYLRTAKKIALSPEVREMLDVDAAEMSGEELICAVLCMRVDLLWNGGVGTYVKASAETHTDVGDSANDNVRVDADRLRARVAGEGGNLGFTQSARIEYALRGGHINTDAIDNAGGVNMSDHEVNLKIALGPLLESGELAPAERNRVLTDVGDAVAAHVLATNRRQALALSIEQQRSQKRLYDFLELMRRLETESELDRALDRLPDRETLRGRRASFLGLTRPELAVLLAHSKLALQHRLLSSALPDDPALEQYLDAYFPRPVIERFRHAVRSHRLRREIIAVEVANRLIDVAGMTFVSRLQRDTGSDAAAVVRAWVVAVAIADAAPLYERLLDPPTGLPYNLQVAAMLALEEAIERACHWTIQTQSPTDTATEVISRLKGPVFELGAHLDALLPPEALARAQDQQAALEAEGLEGEAARRLARLDYLAEMLEIAHLSIEMQTAVGLAGEIYYRINSLIDLDWLQQTLTVAAGEDRWEQRAAAGLAEGLVYARRVITQNILNCGQRGDDVGRCLEEYGRVHAAQLEAIGSVMKDVKSASRPTLAALVVVMREIGRLCSRG